MNNSDFPLVGLLTANISLDAVARVVQLILPVLNAAAILLQVGIGIFTLLYVYRKWVNYRKQDK